MMRHALIDEVRRKGRAKRGGDLQRVPLEEARMLAIDEGGLDLDALEAALEQLASWDERKARIVELRFFAGMSGEEISQSLGISRATVTREWRRARTWLFQELQGAPVDG
jgi:RNA polymerase sigma factor (TIGR02999 family)